MIITDFLVVGGGIIGLNIARELKRLYSDSKVILIEKEKECGLHASGRNSGVLHAGFYYSPDSLKAKFTRLGNKMLTGYCESKEIAINRCGKLVVAKDKSDHVFFDELLKRGRDNEIELQEITEKEARLIEPRVKTHERAIFSPTTATVDLVGVVKAMKDDAIREGVEVHCGVSFIKKRRCDIITSTGIYQTDYFVNAAGLYADKIALDFGFSERYRVLPFKGLYLYSNESPGAIRTNIYPVPDLRNPFLGVHFTVTVDGRVKIGPTAIPAFWREHYQRFENFKYSELADIMMREISLLKSANFDFKRLAFEELKKYSRARMVFLASSLVNDMKKDNYKKWGKPGIRAQLLDIKEKKLVMDFVLESDDKSMHILNAVSPAFTCSLPFSHFVCGEIQSHLN
ncbi:MAG: L-2-hydroxyglutarate oxidase [Candidatus Kuenenia sp.]|nr:L-2-hydroxyglutarate oxidase [Candidatus Kuenenia hertensis]